MRGIIWIVLTATAIVLPIALLRTPAGAAALDSLTTPSVPATTKATAAAPSSPATRTTQAKPTARKTKTTAKVKAPKDMREAPMLSVGASGEQVTDLQARLARAGYFKHEVTGYYGTVTAQAVRSFQAAKSLAVTGDVDRATWRAVQALPLPQPTAKVSTKTAKGLDPRCTVGRVLCIDKTARRLSWVVDGKVIDSYSVRTGRAGLETREGTFHVFRKERNSWSNLYHVNMPYSMYFSGGQAVHYSTEFATQGYGVGSHGCVNMRDWNGIAWLYSQVQIVDTVVVYRS